MFKVELEIHIIGEIHDLGVFKNIRKTNHHSSVCFYIKKSNIIIITILTIIIIITIILSYIFHSNFLETNYTMLLISLCEFDTLFITMIYLCTCERITQLIFPSTFFFLLREYTFLGPLVTC
jgi:hypothetical protein